MEEDDSRRRALADFARFTGLHQGAETLVATVPPAGWAKGGGSASEVAYAERLSRSRIRVDFLQQRQKTRRDHGGGIDGAGVGLGVGMEAAGGGDPKQAVPAAVGGFGLMLRHAVPAKDVICRTAGF